MDVTGWLAVRRGVIPFGLLCGLLLASRALSARAVGGPAASAPALSDGQKRQLAALRRRAAAASFDEALEAVRQIVAMGPAVRDELNGLLGDLLARNQSDIEAAARAVGDTRRIEPAERKLRELRAEALANIARLKKDDESIPKAWACYRQVLAATRRFWPPMEARSRLVDLVGQRLRLLKIRRRVVAGTVSEAQGGGAASALRPAERALGVSLQAVQAPDDLAKLPGLRELFVWRLNRRTAAYNTRISRTMHPEEALNVATVNDYREALGLERLEIDLRLVQSARRHSKEMADVGYFSHESPVKEHRTGADRARLAGYGSAGGENIATGTSLHSGVKAFEQWFSSPPHHQNMARASFRAIGVGKWGNLWTQNFGHGPRLMLADEATQKAAAPRGRILPRQR